MSEFDYSECKADPYIRYSEYSKMQKELLARFNKVDATLLANQIGLTNVYNEFQKYSLSDISKRMDYMLDKIRIYELQKEVKDFTVNIDSFPMNIRVNLQIRTNFGKITYTYDHPPSLESQLSHTIQGQYIFMLNKLYEEHDKRGGKYMGDSGCGEWHKENGDTIINIEPHLSNRG